MAVSLVLFSLISVKFEMQSHEMSSWQQEMNMNTVSDGKMAWNEISIECDHKAKVRVLPGGHSSLRQYSEEADR